MSEHKSQTRYIPLRVRFRPSSEYYDRERPSSGELHRSTQPLMPDLAHASESERRTQQIKELVRLGALLRADLGLDEVLQQIAASMATCTGFRRLAINLINENGEHLLPVAFAGISEEDERTLRESTVSAETLLTLMRPQFRISQSYFIPHQYSDSLRETTVVVTKPLDSYKEGGWHPEDYLFVPLYSPREQKLLGFLSLDDPEDSTIPTREGIEVVELFAGHAATAIDNALLFHEREEERQALEEAITFLREDLEILQQGDFRRRVRSTHKKLQPISHAINAVIEEVSSILRNIQVVTQAVEEHAQHVQQTSQRLANTTAQQEQHVQRISHIVHDAAEIMSSLSEQTTHLSKTAVEVVDVTLEAQSTVDRAVEGMGMVRETTMQSARTMKNLGESGQEINETVLGLNDLTMRMHLLALNAAIEATRAGEHGQSFAVIAQEIRTLAGQGGQSTSKVGTYIRTIQHETTSVSQSIEQSTQQVIMQTELATQASVALEAISIVTEHLTKLVQELCSTAEKQQQISQLAVSNVSGFLQMKNDTTHHMQEMQQSVTRLAELTNALRSRTTAMRFRERSSPTHSDTGR